MSKNDSKLSQEIDGGAFFLCIFNIIFFIGLIAFSIWFYKNVYKPEEREYINNTKYAYLIIQQELMDVYKERGFIFDENNKKDNFLCNRLVTKYAKRDSGTCENFNPVNAAQNFEFKKKKISVYGLEKPMFNFMGSLVKDIIIDVNGENKGINQVGSDRTIIRIYSTGQYAPIMTPVNCSKSDEDEYGLTRSFYCIGSPELNYLIQSIPLGFDIEQIGGDNGKTRTIGKNLPFLRADCSAFGGDIIGADDYCSDKMLYQLRGCDDEFICNIALSKY